MRRRLRELVALAGGKSAHPVFGLPGGVAKHITSEAQKQFQEVAAEAVDFAQFTLQLFENVVLKNSDYVSLILSDIYTHRTHYMGILLCEYCAWAMNCFVVADQLRQFAFSDVDICCTAESGLHLLDRALGVGHLVVIDTVQTDNAPPGTIYQFLDSELPPVRGDRLTTLDCARLWLLPEDWASPWQKK